MKTASPESTLQVSTMAGPALTPPPSSPSKGWWRAGAILLALSLVLHIVGWVLWRQTLVSNQTLTQLREEILALQTQAQAWQPLKATLDPALQDIASFRQALERCQTDQAQLQAAIKQVQDQQKTDKAWLQQQWRDYKSSLATPKLKPRDAINNPDVYW